jgi:hypothetical protein
MQSQLGGLKYTGVDLGAGRRNNGPQAERFAIGTVIATERPSGCQS